ncbi:MAG TPA: YihY/virulence factor BrkB family protein, partial [Solirubrobacterales bacterium]|nr:YihY/virulence factor BrkB family protein [Solirubrobacterales bacterium]
MATARRMEHGSWRAVVKRSVAEFRDDNLTDWAAALTYYGILAIFPAILAVVSILGLIGSNATQPLLDNLAAVAPGPAQETLTSAVGNLQESRGAAGLMLIVGLALALWSASSYVAAFMRASNDIWDVEEGRPIWRTLPTRVLTTLALLLMLGAVAVGVTFTGGLAEAAGEVLGVEGTALDVWDIVKWPVIILAVMTMLALLYWAAPNVKHPGFR